MTDVLRATQDAINMAARSNVNFYTIDPRGLVGATSEFMSMKGSGLPQAGTQLALMEELRTSQDSLRTLAEETGGFAALNSNSFASAFERIVERNSRYYLLGYYMPDHPRNGRFHTISVRAKRPGLQVMARSGYASPRGGKTVEELERDDASRRAREAKRPDGDTTSAELREVLDTPLQQSALALAVHAAPFKHTDKEASVALAIEIDGESLRLPSDRASVSNSLEVSFFGINDQGKATEGVRKELGLTLKPEMQQRVKAYGIRLNPRISLTPGRYQLRIGVRETASGANGSVFYDLIVPDFRKEALVLSGLLLTSASAQRTPTAELDPVVSKLLPGSVTSRREFPVGDTLAVYCEVYDNSSSRQPRQIDVAVRLISKGGSEVFTATDLMTSASSKPSSISAEVVLKDLEPGRYLLRVEAQMRGATSPLLTRETLIMVIP